MCHMIDYGVNCAKFLVNKHMVKVMLSAVEISFFGLASECMPY